MSMYPYTMGSAALKTTTEITIARTNPVFPSTAIVSAHVLRFIEKFE
ncbi:predicted protein [Sclerotinia sclerotiorum 1980 UF-70]|uniref:Uncharacterized protein n=1 Tax=Sclerotinia sclerotiorum (strain ATCC 18683 / 1980 / Ss-1) TaxID=665079 RepID=A7F2L2_SCLS1|nr:predicted protein [Sclerotinia sclerotiorum 1980 UF-70]EDN95954.1 predicted protein [Sclerotinia sclerotiorum 1980 UF-70]